MEMCRQHEWGAQRALRIFRKEGRAEDGPKQRKRTGRDACPTKSSKLRLLGGFGLEAVVRQGEARFVAVAGVLVEHALGDGLVNGRHRGVQEIAGSGGVAGGNG